MPKPKNKYDREHLHNLDVYQEYIDAIYAEAVKEAAAIGVSLDDVDISKPFTFDDYPRTRKRVNALLEQLRSQLQMSIVNAVRSEWTLSNNKNNELCNVVFGNNVGKLSEEQYRRYYSTNEKALEAFIKRKERGLNLSDRVWNYSNTFKREMEMGLDLGIREGLDAPSMARDLKQYLRHPDKLFRRVRDEHGNLHLSKAAADFHPGHGVYRSSYLNARRLAATETNIAYRTADHERWQRMDFVVGIEIHLSNNHNCKGFKPGTFHDICDQLKGKYPKDFKFTGWHPHCRCYATTILKTDDEIEADTQKILRGEPLDGESVNKVEDVPEGFKEWEKKNEERMKAAKEAGTLPRFVRENEELVSGAKSEIKGDSVRQVPIGSAAMPSGLGSYEQKEWNDNEIEVSEKLEITQGWPMTHEQADEHHANPNYIKGEKNGYNTNCQSCVVAYEMRRRGFDVEALRHIWGDETNGPWKLSLQTESAWIDMKTGDIPKKTLCGGAYDVDARGRLKYKTIGMVNEDLNTATIAPGRYHISWVWKKKDYGHVIVAERFPDGKMRLFDPQTGEIFDWGNKSKGIDLHKGVYALKVDDLLLNTQVVSKVVKAKVKEGRK